MSIQCCTLFLQKKSGSSPFEIIYLLDYYDGAVAGFLRCRICNKKYFFWMIAWDKWQAYRLFAIREFAADLSELIESRKHKIDKFIKEPLPKAIEEEIRDCQNSKNLTYLYTQDIERKIDKILLSFSR
ncbi:MAG: hypothetical protein HQM15_08695 [Deltaproteobacteria bacterium]|nr:hypothetical protein [Deltaproteobacteria bacterium]